MKDESSSVPLPAPDPDLIVIERSGWTWIDDLLCLLLAIVGLGHATAAIVILFQ